MFTQVQSACMKGVESRRQNSQTTNGIEARALHFMGTKKLGLCVCSKKINGYSMMAVSLPTLSTEDLLEKLKESGINITEDEARKFRELQQVVDCLLDSPFHPFLEIFRPSLMTKNHARSPLRTDTEFHEAMIEHTMYPTNAEYVQVAKELIVKYPFLKDLEGNGYHTWHQSLKRKFKSDRAPLIHEDEVRKRKEKFGHTRVRLTEQSPTACCRSESRLLKIAENELQGVKENTYGGYE
ncbi:hypothetical protein E1301_Tti018962 [Triplophysa tibetana]|uniref:Uncharacterized protein n=1 Tax=Triplophysa tibetana TaxID=1572043 RepID=A0A5A9MXH3_9TELE|nr:hypothetical protein E1301_Tti018962 [Triplophysa tibetana]